MLQYVSVKDAVEMAVFKGKFHLFHISHKKCIIKALPPGRYLFVDLHANDLEVSPFTQHGGCLAGTATHVQDVLCPMGHMSYQVPSGAVVVIGLSRRTFHACWIVPS